MKSTKDEWVRLENASKIFPAVSGDKDSKVFRIVCELKEPVDPQVLQQALNITIECFPLYKSVLRRGAFWYYFEESDIKPTVEPESRPVCSPIYYRGRHTLLFRVLYYRKRISLEVFHALTDGTGAFWFMQNMVQHYLLIKHQSALEGRKPELLGNGSMSEKMNDSFQRHFIGSGVFKRNPDKKKATRAFQLRGSRLEENRIQLIEGSMSVKSVLREAHEHDASLTIYLASVFICSIYKSMTAWEKRRPVTLSVPVNLRQFYESGTARNFFTTISVSCHFTDSVISIEDIIEVVKAGFEEGMKKENLAGYLDRLLALEKNLLAKAVPLPLKDLILRIGDRVINRGVTSSISNVGKIKMPAGFDDYIQQFSCFLGARRPQLTLCSFGDRLVISFSSPFKDSEIAKTFFQLLSNNKIEISSNL